MASSQSNPQWLTARTRAPAKLNLFLELLHRRDDGYHQIDTIMVPIDWCDEISLRRTDDERIRLSVHWLPSKQVIASRLGLTENSDESAQLLGIPEDEHNLVYQALARFRDQFRTKGGFDCRIQKRIPAGAGLGGASSDAAAALRCAAALCQIPKNGAEIYEIAASIGSDVPFFLGCADDRRQISDPRPTFAARARGRGEILTPVTLRSPLHFVVAFPSECLSTAAVYASSHLPQVCNSPEGILNGLRTGSTRNIGQHMFNRLADPARKILPRIDEILDSMWRCGLQACQLTGSGSACFAIQSTKIQADRGAMLLRAMLEPGALISNVRNVCVPSQVVCA